MNKTSRRFMELVKAGIGKGDANATFFNDMSEKEWHDIFQLTLDQRMIAIVHDGIYSLPQDLMPPKRDVLKLAMQTEAIEKRNRELNAALADITEKYAAIDCPFALLKGQGNALYYPNPLHRTPGDLDLFLFREGDYQKANQWAREQGCNISPENIHHLGFDYGDFYIENHKYVTYFGIRKYERQLQHIIQEIVDKQLFEQKSIDGLAVNVLPTEFNAFYIFQHLFHHFIHLGIGMRQVCDWVLFLEANRDRIGCNSFTQLATSFDLLKAMQVFAGIAIKYLNAEPAIFPFPLKEQADDAMIDFVLNDVLHGGYFGFSRLTKKNFIGKWDRKWHSFKVASKRSRKILPLAPSHIRSIPLIKLNTNIKLLFK